MEDIKLWKLDGKQTTPLDSNSQWESESLFEDTLVENPDLLIDRLTLVGRQTPTEGGGRLDLLGVDPKGKLVVFELKRGRLSRDAVAQIIDYASFLDNMDLDALADRISKESGNHGIDKIENFREWYRESFDELELESLKPLRMFLVGLGADHQTERMVRFLAQNSKMDISLLTFHAFDYNGKTILAKQEEIANRSGRGRRTTEELLRDFDEKMERYGTRDLVDEALNMFREKWPESRETTQDRGIAFRLRHGVRHSRYARIDTWDEGKISVAFFSRAKALCLHEFSELVRRNIEYRIEPRKYEGPADAWEKPETDIHFHLTPQEWEAHKGSLSTLAQAIYAAWQDENEDAEAESSQ